MCRVNEPLLNIYHLIFLKTQFEEFLPRKSEKSIYILGFDVQSLISMGINCISETISIELIFV